ncbi:MAG: hypothetical protein CMK09_02370 [Ponticaulis sp.]|nr:hypothetical protein [Ponticaulis sp.]|tara:strand:+ start:32528 stop:33343 length:816 start_codon:yes stop_codon:yes gene_type:complete
MQDLRSPRVLLTLLLTAGVTACATTAPTEEELAYEAAVKDRTLMRATDQQREEIKLQDPMTQATFWSLEYEKSPGDVKAATEFAKALRAIGSEQRAAEVASQTLALAPDNVELLTLFGKSLLSSGDPATAADVLRRATNLNPDDHTILVALGVAYDQTGRHREAQSSYRRVLQTEPNSAAALSNLGLSLVLTGETDEAEMMLRRAVIQPEAGTRERQNLALVLSVQGKFDEARAVGASDLPDDLVDQNIDYFKAMLTPKARRYTALRGTQN